ncbi:hypothetical protein INT45_002250 [Circinella minor]|uniref:Uncharacterized protein n=1 Tax=Circinella minor TaxID=1195481 RepID=A0A8H7SFF7_9FUNG|nr:hypothetical protein INT45_002250 [Circinella minor]
MDNDYVSSPEKRGPGRPSGSKNKPKCKRLPAGQITIKDIVTNPSVLSQIRNKANLVAEIEEDEGHETNNGTIKEVEEDEAIPNTMKSIENELKSYNERNNG